MLRAGERERKKEGGKEGGGREEGRERIFKVCPYDHHTTFQRTMQRHKATNDTCFFILVSHCVKSNNKTQKRRKMVRLRMSKYSGNFSI